MLEKIAKLLNQAENAGTPEEASVFMEKAQTLATTYSVDLAKARHATKSKEKTVPEQRTIHIGEPRSRGLRTLVDLYLGIANANDIRVTIAHNATRVYAVGFKEDLDISEALYASLVTQQAKAVEDFKRGGEWKNEKVYVRDGYGWGEYKSQTWLTARLNFQDAYANRIRYRLSEAKRAEEKRIKDAEVEVEQAEDSAPGAALVLVEKREALDEAYAPLLRQARGSYRGGTSGASSDSGSSAGRAAADRARLGGSTSIGGAKGAISA